MSSLRSFRSLALGLFLATSPGAWSMPLGSILEPAAPLEDPAPPPEPSPPPEPAPAPEPPESAAVAEPAPPPPTPPAPVPAQDGRPAEPKPARTIHQTPEVRAAQTGFRLGVEMDHALGQGIFVDARYSLFVGTLVLAPSYSFLFRNVRLNASAQGSFSWEYTPPDNATGRRWSYSDIRLGLSAPAVWRESRSGVSLTPTFGLLVPISLESRYASTITSLSLGARLSRRFLQKLDVGLTLTGSRGVHGRTFVGTLPSNARDEQGNLLFVCRRDEAYCGILGNNTAWSTAAMLDVGYAATENLRLFANFGLSKAWKYAPPRDEYSSKAVSSNGTPVVCDGVCTADRMTGVLGVSYALTDVLGLSGAVSTLQQPLTNQGSRSVRFPFFDFLSTADNLTSYSLTLSARF